MTDADMSLAVVMPVFNEERTVGEMCKRLSQIDVVCEIIVIDDASNDCTPLLLETWATHPKFRILRHAKNRGKGAAIRTGLPFARSRLVIIQDADLEYSPREICTLVSASLTADVTLGSRYIDLSWRDTFLSGAGALVGRVVVVALNFIVRVLYGTRITDEATCYKLFRTRDLRRMQLQCDGFEFCPEVVAKASRLGLTFNEVPISYARRGWNEGKKISARDACVAVQTLWQYRNWNPTPFACRSSTQPISRQAFTLVELLATIAIVGILLLIAVPAVQSSRESARTVHCQSNLRQLALACLSHEAAQTQLPTNGWGWRWVGDPTMGYNRRQPGSWAYNILPYLEEGDLRSVGQQLSPPERMQELTQVVQTPLIVMHCPSKRPPDLYPFTAESTPVNVAPVTEAAKTDYACNGGDRQVQTGTGPEGLLPHQLSEYEWPNVDHLSGVIHAFSEVRIHQITDGTSKTYMIGEKLIPLNHYADGASFGDDQTMFLGDDADTRRWTFEVPISDRNARFDQKTSFGSAHPGKCLFVYCDGTVKSISLDIDPELNRANGNRYDNKR